MGDEELNNSTKEDHEESRGAVGGRDDKKKDKSIIKFGKTLAKEFDLKDTTIDILLDNEIDSMSALATLSKDDVLSFNLSLGQKNLLLKCVASLTPADTHAAHESTLSKDARSRQKELALRIYSRLKTRYRFYNQTQTTTGTELLYVEFGMK